MGLDQLPAIVTAEHPWHLLHKRHWPAPPYPENIDNPLPANELIKQLNIVINRENRPYLIVQTDISAGSWRVLKRYFVTPPAWPHSLGYRP
ncbi:MAG: hypothetical protein ACI8W7_002792 [Gammaproteobacteria bacterium]